MEFSIEKHNTLSPVFKKQHEQLENECFGWVRTLTHEQRVEHHDRFCSEKDKFLYLLAIQNSSVIGQLTLLKREIVFQGEKLLLGGIGGVCVTAKKRRKGVATALLKIAVQELQKVNCDVAYFCFDTKNLGLLKLYSQIGFVLLNKPHTYKGKSGKYYTDYDGMIAPIRSLKIFKQILTDKSPFDIGKGNW